MTLEPLLARLDRLLEDEGLVQRVKAALLRRAPHTAPRGRPSTPVEVILRRLVVKRVYPWSDEATAHGVADSLGLRQFCRVSLAPVPDDTTRLRWAKLIEPATLAALNDRVIALARSVKVTRGRKLRVASTVVETNLHYPTDSGLLGGRVRRWRQQRHRLARHPGEAATEPLQHAEERLIAVVRKTPAQAVRVCPARRAQTVPTAQRLVRQCEQFRPRVERVINQTVRRVLQGEVVPAQDKLVSLFEPHPQLIVRRKTGKAVEFGRQVWVEAVEGGLISGSRSLAEAGQDFPSLPDRLVAHQPRFGKPPWRWAADRGGYAAANEAVAQQARGTRLGIPYAGKAPPARVAQERAAWLRRGLRVRAGSEGRSSVLRRRFGLDRCRDHGAAGLGRWVGWGIRTANLVNIAHTGAGRSPVTMVRAA